MSSIVVSTTQTVSGPVLGLHDFLLGSMWQMVFEAYFFAACGGPIVWYIEITKQHVFSYIFQLMIT